MNLIGERISIVKKDDELKIVILSERDKFKNKLLLLWLILWTLSGICVFIYFLQQQDKNTKLALLVWIAFWAYFEFKIYKAALWRSKGIEVIKIKPEKLLYQRIFNSPKKYLTYKIDFIKDLRMQTPSDASFTDAMNNSYWLIAGEKLVFDYFGKEIKLGLQLSEADAKLLWKLLTKELKNNSEDKDNN
jgi:hypothetical protein